MYLKREASMWASLVDSNDFTHSKTSGHRPDISFGRARNILKIGESVSELLGISMGQEELKIERR
jgi:hypothetical protein